MNRLIAILFFFLALPAIASTRYGIAPGFSDLLKAEDVDRIEANCKMVDGKRNIEIKAWNVSANPKNFDYEVHYKLLSSGPYVFKSSPTHDTVISLWMDKTNENPPRPYKYMTVWFGPGGGGSSPSLNMDFTELMAPIKFTKSEKTVTVVTNHNVTLYSRIPADYEIWTGADCVWNFVLK